MPWPGAGGRRGGKQNAAREVSGSLQDVAAPLEKVGGGGSGGSGAALCQSSAKPQKGNPPKISALVFFIASGSQDMEQRGLGVTGGAE